MIPLLVTLLTLAPGEGPPDPDRPYAARRSEPVRYAVDFRVIVTPLQGTKKLTVWLPVPQSDFGQEVSPGEVTTFPAEVAPRYETEKLFGNRFAYFEFDDPKGA